MGNIIPNLKYFINALLILKRRDTLWLDIIEKEA
jgi:hypothetical protein